MKVDFLEDIGDARPLIRLWNCTNADLENLARQLSLLLHGIIPEFDIFQIEGIMKGAGIAKLIFKKGRRITQVQRRNMNTFISTITKKQIEKIIEKISLYNTTYDKRGHFWLDDHSHISILLSDTGGW